MIAPDEPHSIFVHAIAIRPEAVVIIYFPTFNSVLDLEIGVKKDSNIMPVQDFYSISRPILFYGNSCTQGASASRSGNAYPNIVSRLIDADILNFSFSGACRAEISMAKEIIQYDLSAVIIDYHRNAISLSEFYDRFEVFYKFIRQNKPKMPIIMIGASNAPIYDIHIKKVFQQIKKEEDCNTFYIDLNDLFKGLNNFALNIDDIHYTDVGMFRIAEKIEEYLRQVI